MEKRKEVFFTRACVGALVLRVCIVCSDHTLLPAGHAVFLQLWQRKSSNFPVSFIMSQS